MSLAFPFLNWRPPQTVLADISYLPSILLVISNLSRGLLLFWDRQDIIFYEAGLHSSLSVSRRQLANWVDWGG